MSMENQNPSGGEQVAFQRSSTSALPWRLMVFSIVLFAFSFLVFFGIRYGYAASLDAQSSQLTKDAAALDKKISEQSANQDSYLGLYSRIYNLKSVLQKHIFPSNGFVLLEKYSIADAYFLNENYSVEEGGFRLNGLAKTFDALAQQMAIFEQSAKAQIASVSLKDVSISEKGVQFEIILIPTQKFMEAQRDSL